jgi:hypothetical protein
MEGCIVLQIFPKSYISLFAVWYGHDENETSCLFAKAQAPSFMSANASFSITMIQYSQLQLLKHENSSLPTMVTQKYDF